MTERQRIESLLDIIVAGVTEIYKDNESRINIPIEIYKKYLEILSEYRELGYCVSGNTMEIEISMYVIELDL